MTKGKNKTKKVGETSEDIYKDYEPDGKDLNEWLSSSEEQDPNYDPEDHWASIETDKLLGK